MNRALSLNTNPTGILGAAAALYAAAVMLYNYANHHGVIDPEVIIAAISAAAFLYTRFKVTPTADPKNGAGEPLVTATVGPPLPSSYVTPPAPPAPPAA